MDDMAGSSESSGMTKVGGAVAVALARVVVPLWLLAGAVLKLVDSSPSHLPAALIRWMGALGVDLGFVLRFSIAVELVVAGVMWLVPRLARPIGIAMLASFLPVLIGDVALGASSCGCFGAVRVHPGVTLAMDLGFLLGLWLLGRRVERLATPASLPTLNVVAAGIWVLASFALAFGLTTGGDPPALAAEGDPASVAAAAAGPVEGYFLPRYEDWIGNAWSELPISGWIQGAPSDLGVGPRLVLFYRKDCEHCHALMEAYFVGPLAVPTTAVAVPERAGFPTVGVQPFPCDECSRAELPPGVDWFLQTPILVRLDDGVVRCAAEVSPEAPACLDE
jgi:hypothetical protein